MEMKNTKMVSDDMKIGFINCLIVSLYNLSWKQLFNCNIPFKCNLIVKLSIIDNIIRNFLFIIVTS